jgi:VIT1/CCC1 family predicted Fe2+/Mn2+ transporter
VPFFIINNYFVSLGVTVLIAITIIAIFNYYLAIAKRENFRKRFTEMAVISIGVAAISFMIGFVVKKYFGLEI